MSGSTWATEAVAQAVALLPKKRLRQTAHVGSTCVIVESMASQKKVPSPKDIKAAAQAAAETAQAVASSAMRLPPTSIQLATEIPELIENLATATERLNTAIDRAERYLALADPMIRTMDAMLPQLEALVATGNDVYKAVSSVPPASPLWGGWPPAAAQLRHPPDPGYQGRTTKVGRPPPRLSGDRRPTSVPATSFSAR